VRRRTGSQPARSAESQVGPGSRSPSAISMVAVAPRLRLESALGQTGTTVTAFLEQLVGEPVDAYERGATS